MIDLVAPIADVGPLSTTVRIGAVALRVALGGGPHHVDSAIGRLVERSIEVDPTATVGGGRRGRHRRLRPVSARIDVDVPGHPHPVVVGPRGRDGGIDCRGGRSGGRDAGSERLVDPVGCRIVLLASNLERVRFPGVLRERRVVLVRVCLDVPDGVHVEECLRDRVGDRASVVGEEVVCGFQDRLRLLAAVLVGIRSRDHRLGFGVDVDQNRLHLSEVLEGALQLVVRHEREHRLGIVDERLERRRDLRVAVEPAVDEVRQHEPPLPELLVETRPAPAAIEHDLF